MAQGFETEGYKKVSEIFDDLPTEEQNKDELINNCFRRIQVLGSQVNAYRKRLNEVEGCLTVKDPREKVAPCKDCGRPLTIYCARCDK